jgi:flagellar basal-body rod protein FlgG
MMRALLTAATGMDAQQLTVDTIANNLANVNTSGFKRSRANFHDLLYQTIKAPGQSSTVGTVIPSGIQIGSGTQVSSVEKMFTEGGIIQTKKETDMMIQGEGFFRVQLDDGRTAYTRDGSFKWDSNGRLVTADGFPVMPEITIPPGVAHNKFNVGFDGAVTVRVGEEVQELGQLQLANFINPAGLDSLGRNMYGATVASGEPIVSAANQDGVGAIAQGQLESSNVNVIEEMVNMITGQRAYELNSKVIQAGDQMLQQTNNIR